LGESEDEEISVKKSHILYGHHFAILSLIFNPDASKILSGGADYTIKIWDVIKGKLLSEVAQHSS